MARARVTTLYSPAPLPVERRLRAALRQIVQVYRSKIWLIVGIAAVFQLPFVLLDVADYMVLYKPLSGSSSAAQSLTLLAILLVGWIWSVLGFFLLAGAVIHASSTPTSSTPSPRRLLGSYGVALRRFGTLFRTTLLYVVAVAAMSATIVGLPFAIYYAAKWFLFDGAVVIERTGAVAALRRSSALVPGSWRTVVGTVVVTAGLAWAVILFNQFVLEPGFLGDSSGPTRVAFYVASDPLRWFIHHLLTMLVTPVIPIATAVLFLQLRARKESETGAA